MQHSTFTTNIYFFFLSETQPLILSQHAPPDKKKTRDYVSRSDFQNLRTYNNTIHTGLTISRCIVHSQLTFTFFSFLKHNPSYYHNMHRQTIKKQGTTSLEATSKTCVRTTIQFILAGLTISRCILHSQLTFTFFSFLKHNPSYYHNMHRQTIKKQGTTSLEATSQT
jgi:acyl CoA:acetate/3-ketoacid CoA transferase alpha subunit